MDIPFNHGYRCSEHGIGYLKQGGCPTCASLKNPPKVSKKNQKAIRQLLRKANRKK